MLNDIHKVYEAVAKPLVAAYHFFDVSPKSNWVAHPDSGMGGGGGGTLGTEMYDIVYLRHQLTSNCKDTIWICSPQRI